MNPVTLNQAAHDGRKEAMIMKRTKSVTVKPHSVTRYELVCDEEEVFEPCGCMASSKREAVKELKSVRRYCPEAYVANVAYTRASVR
ncbi:MAG TPA: hypothetical protein DCQ94_02540 [Nitrospira sp.]|nr:hypothetical protein [Nitrospira sp.]